MMIDTEWFRIKPDPDAPAVEVDCFDAKKYPYFTDAESFAALDHSVVHYERDKFSPCDILFQPTFLIGDRLLELFKLLEPSMEFKGVQMYRKFKPADAPCPLFWLPYLPPVEIKFTHRQVVQDELSFVSKKMGANRENQNIYCDSTDLHLGERKFNQRAVVQDELSFMSKKLPALYGRRVAHFRLPDEDIWLLSLEAAECLLRRQPVGIVLEKIFIQP